jgi:hypothetical protein
VANARQEFVDAVTGLPVREVKPGAVPSGRWVTRVRPSKGQPIVSVEIDREELGPPTSQRVDLTRPELLARAKAEADRQAKAGAADVRAAKRTGKQKVRGVGETFRTAGKAAREFIDANHEFFDRVESLDLGDTIHDWMDGIEVRRGKVWRKLNKTTKGTAILEKFRAGRGGAFDALLTWLFSQARSKRWTDVDWSTLDRMEEEIRKSPDGAGLPALAYRPAASIDAAAMAVEHMTEKQAEEAARVFNQQNLEDLSRELATAYKAARKCLDPEERKVIRERARLVADLAKHPTKVWGLTLCVPEGQTRICGLPVLEAELVRVRRACDKGYDPDWPIREAREAAARGDESELDQYPQGVRDVAEQRRNPGARVVPARAEPKTRSNPKAPALADLGTVAELGRIESVDVERDDGTIEQYRWKGSRPMLLWSPKARALFWIEGAKPSGLRKGAPRSDGAAKIFENFAEGRPAEQHRTMVLPLKRPRKMGRAVRIVYTEPWGRAAAGTRWEHDFSPSDVFWKAGGASPFLFAVTGPRLTVTERGIVY